MGNDFFLGLDIGTDSVGYAVTDNEYNLLKHKGEYMWGCHVFKAGNQAAKRRSYRTARRRNDRKKQRISLVSEIFAPEIAKIDERFFIRRRESALFRDDVAEHDRYIVFNDDNFTDKDYYEKYPTIHHLIQELMQDKPHDVRLVYIACAYLVAHRGHFLSEVGKDNIDEVLNFDKVYDDFTESFEAFFGNHPWECDRKAFQKILCEKALVSKKEKDFLELLNNGKKYAAAKDEAVSKEGLIKLLSGGTYDMAKLFPDMEIEEKLSVCFKKSEDEFLSALELLDDRKDFLIALRNLYDWAVLSDILNGKKSISEGKIEIYNQHSRDLKYLKDFIRRYRPEKYSEIFRSATEPANYVSYSYNTKSTERTKDGKAAKEEFCDYIKKIVKDVSVPEEERKPYDDMMLRLSLYSFMPKQVEGDNRIIPYQLYYYELAKILDNAEKYLPFLSEKDMDGYSNKQKLLSIMEFRIPYYVGPLKKDNGEHAWIKRKAEGKIYPWNFEKIVDLDESEKEFIKRMTNRCTYIPNEPVIPKYSLLYCKFTVLNEINNIKINGESIPVSHKQAIYMLFTKKRRVTVKDIKDYLKSNNLLSSEEGKDVLSGLDVTIKSSLKSYHDFKRILNDKTLTESQVEDVIEHLAYSSDRSRMARWLRKSFPSLPDADAKYISKLKYNDFGRISKKLLTGITGCHKETGEMMTVISALWNTNDNLSQILLSDKYSFAELLSEIKAEHYGSGSVPVENLLNDMYVSNAVKRPIYRTLDIVKDIHKVCGCSPKRIFIEMARGGDAKKERTKSRREQIKELYKSMDRQEIRELSEQLESRTDNELQSEMLFLYFMQLGKSAYSGRPLDIEKLKLSIYNIDHIYPRTYVKDDSIDNKVLVFSEENSAKADNFPIAQEIRDKMKPFWNILRKNDLISDKKYNRLIRNTPFSEEEKMGFINRQLVETRQSTKAIAAVLKNMFPDTEIVYSKAGLVSDFRHEFDILKCRSVNDLHHAKDAYLNIVVGNVYYCKFTKNFYIDRDYSLKTKTIFTNSAVSDGQVIWEGEKSIQKVKKILSKNAIHYTQFAYIKKGGLFDQNPLKASEGLIPRKKGLDSAKYGGYAKSAAAGFLLVQYKDKGKKEAMIMPVDLMWLNTALANEKEAEKYAKENLMSIWERAEDEITDIRFPLGLRLLKVNTILSFDGFRACISGKSNKGQKLGLSSMMPLTIGYNMERYIKRMEAFLAKKEKNKNLILNEEYDKISENENFKLYHILTDKLANGPYGLPFATQKKLLTEGEERFFALDIERQVYLLMQIVLLLKSGRAGTCNLSDIGGNKNTGTYACSSKISNWKKNYENVCIVDVSPSGLHEKKSFNLLELL